MSYRSTFAPLGPVECATAGEAPQMLNAEACIAVKIWSFYTIVILGLRPAKKRNNIMYIYVYIVYTCLPIYLCICVSTLYLLILAARHDSAQSPESLEISYKQLQAVLLPTGCEVHSPIRSARNPRPLSLNPKPNLPVPTFTETHSRARIRV